MPAQPLLPLVPRAASALLCGFAASALAGVIPGTGTAPSASQLGATDAVAMQRSASHKGHVLLTPYFTAQNGQMTVLHLVNTDPDNGKAIKLRLRGAANGDSLLSMTILLKPADIWTGAITAGADGRAQITTTDESCSVPRLATGVPQSLGTDRLNPALSQAERANQTREGTVEAILTADIPTKYRLNADGSIESPLWKALNPVYKRDCNDPALDAATLQDIGDEATAAALGFATPSGGISGTWYIIDVPGATTFSSAMTALEAVNAAGQPARGNYMQFPATEQAIDQPERYTSDPLLVSAMLSGRVKSVDGVVSEPTATAVVQARAYDFPDLSTPFRLPASPANAARTAYEVSRALTATEISNQFSVEKSISAQTDWVFSMPTTRYSVGMDYTTRQPTYSAVPPAGEGPQHVHSQNTTVQNGRVCFGYQLIYDYTRAGKQGQGDVGDPKFCGAATVVPIHQRDLTTTFTPSMLSASVALWPRELPNFLETTGWARVVPGADVAPVIGHAFIKLVNPSVAPGMAASYGLLYPHIVTRPRP